MADVVMPRLSDTMEEGTVSRWLKAEGDPVRRGDVLAEIETDKATMELEAYDEGVLQRLLVPEGTTVPIGQPVAIIGEAAPEPPPAAPEAPPTAPEAPAAAPPAEPAAPPPAAAAPPTPGPPPAAVPAEEPPAPAAPQTPVTPPAAAPTEPTAAAPPPAEPAVPPTGVPAGRPPTSPLARKIARERGVDLSTVAGTGPNGRIVRADVEAAVRRRAAEEKRPAEEVRPPGPPPVTEEARPAGAPPAPPPVTAPPAPPPVTAPPAPPPVTAPTVAAPVEVEEVPLTPVRRITAQRLTESATTTPHFHLTSVVDAGALLAFRHQVNEQLAATGRKVTVTDLLIRACAVALRAHPHVNSSWAGDRIVNHRRVHIGVAVALDDGLIVPVVRDADRKSLGEIAAEAHDLAARARSGKLTPDEFRGGTFTISNLGMYGIDQFTAVINPPEAAILAVGAATDQPALAQGGLTTRTTMRLTLGIDHRVLDGATAARFLADLRSILEQPLRIVT